jgi:hypothetical protein
MKLETMREVKEVARGRLQQIDAPQIGVFAEAVKPEIDLKLATTLGWVTLGIATRATDDDFGLAVRIRLPETSPQLENSIREAVKGLVSPAELDLRHTGPVFTLRANSSVAAIDDVLTIGSSISHLKAGGGTLGFFAKSRIAGETGTGIVSANHVIGLTDRAKPGDAIIHPSRIDGGSDPADTVAELVRSVPLGGAGLKIVDASFARLKTQNYDPTLLRDGRRLSPQVAALREDYNVTKYGRKSWQTEGHVTSFDNDSFEVIDYPGHGVVRFENQIEIESTSSAYAFARRGDSGSLVYNSSLRAVGLLFAQTLRGGRLGNGLSYANPIGSVLDLLKVDPLP